ncbi:ester cyclase [Ovoidimarina sediminis]|uniref:ester cyclase n=1 Tax=Ovoidimarina sediminis TaxID=3079856 RepID=UPI00290EF5D2|nr:ester cyclase [Rhodophyticola sp. MJ-SS7]MDU8946625.1 ester cyclase [Rhodophyticola sp. MJ-SS7]
MSDFRAEIATGLDRLFSPESPGGAVEATGLIAEDAIWDVAAPVNQLEGRDAIVGGFVAPLRAAMTGLRRRDEIVIGGDNIRDPGGRWVVILTHYVGTFAAPLFGLRPSGRLALLRSGEFYRIEGGRITEAKILFDLPDLARQAGRNPFPPDLGTEMLFPGPATHDGVCPGTGDGRASLDLVQAMLSDLHVFDPDTSASPGQTGDDGVWHDEMLWYGPGGIGSTYRWQGFVDDHRAAFLHAFPDRKGGNHYCRIGDGNYAAVSGWPSMTMTHQGDYLGVPATGKALTLRVMDFYRCDFTGPRGKIAENWVCLDYVDLFGQMGVDLIARANALP